MRQNTQNETYIIIDIANNIFQKHTNHTGIYAVNPYYKVNPEPQLQGKNPNYK